MKIVGAAPITDNSYLLSYVKYASGDGTIDNPYRVAV